LKDNMMSFTNSNVQALLDAIDKMIDTHGVANPVLAHDLRAFRVALQEASRQRGGVDMAKMALRFASAIKFMIDHWPGP
jgi:hypothetical protein